MHFIDGTTFDVPAPSRLGKETRTTEHESKSMFQKPFHATKLLRTDPQTLDFKYDKVLVDAECTHDGSIAHIRKYMETEEDDAFESKGLEETRLKQLETLQKSLLVNGFKQVKKGGAVVYSTCSFSPKQNEDVVCWFLRQHPDAILVDLSQEVDKQVPVVPLNKGLKKELSVNADDLMLDVLQKTVRMDPEHSQTSGFFIAKFFKAP